METDAIAQSLCLGIQSIVLTGVLVGGIDDAATSEVLDLPNGLTPLALFAVSHR